jgi:hypothetical protein
MILNLLGFMLHKLTQSKKDLRKMCISTHNFSSNMKNFTAPMKAV